MIHKDVPKDEWVQRELIDGLNVAFFGKSESDSGLSLVGNSQYVEEWSAEHYEIREQIERTANAILLSVLL